MFIYKFRETRRLSLDKEEQARQNSAIRVGEHVQQPAKRDFATNNNECNCENRTGALCTFYSFGAPDALDAVVVKLKTRCIHHRINFFVFGTKCIRAAEFESMRMGEIRCVLMVHRDALAPLHSPGRETKSGEYNSCSTWRMIWTYVHSDRNAERREGACLWNYYGVHVTCSSDLCIRYSKCCVQELHKPDW